VTLQLGFNWVKVSYKPTHTAHSISFIIAICIVEESTMASKGAEEYTTTGIDAEDRKKHRKKRVEKHTATEVINNEDSVEKDQSQNKTGAQQVTDSLFSLDRRKHTGLQDVTSIRVGTNDSESKRRIEDEDLRRSRLAKLQHEALASAKANAAVEMKWGELMEKEIPQELHHDIQIQMDSCNAIIKSKDDLIADFQIQLRAKDEEYVRTLRQQSDDIDELITRIRREFKELQFEYDKELEAIEVSYMEERDRIIGEHTAEIDGMFELRRNKEVQYKEAKQLSEEQYQQDVEALITKGADDYNKLKIDLEMNIQALKQQLEEIRSTYQLNTEKLDYNFRVLTELDVEKNAELSRYKRRLNKLKGQLNTLVTRFTETEAADARTNHELTEDYRGLTLKYKDLQAKFRHFEIADTTKYDEVWAMHEGEVKDLVDQLLKADKIISEQHMGLAWKPPDMHALQHVLGRHGGLGLGANTPAAADLAGAGEENGGEGRPTTGDAEAMELVDLEAARAKKIAGTKVRAVLKMLASEAGFMVNPQVQESLAKMPLEDAEVSRAETMLKALGVKTEERLNTLVNYFFVAHKDEVARFHSDMHDEGKDFEAELVLLLQDPPEDVVELRDMIRPEDVIAAVKAYIEDMSVEAGPVASTAVSGNTKSSQEEIRIAQRRLASMRNYWVQLGQLVNDETVSVWAQLESDCVNTKQMLLQRAQSIQEVDRLTQQNAELKTLLNQYLGDNATNAAFRVPPAQVNFVHFFSFSF
jgi:dynein regulatry complex protein 1